MTTLWCCPWITQTDAAISCLQTEIRLSFQTTKLAFQTLWNVGPSIFGKESNQGDMERGSHLDIQALDLPPTPESMQMMWIEEETPLTVEPDSMPQTLRSSNHTFQNLDWHEQHSAFTFAAIEREGILGTTISSVPCTSKNEPRKSLSEKSAKSLQLMLRAWKR